MMADSLIPDTSNDCYPALVVFDLDACCWCVSARARSAARDATLIAPTHRNLRYPEMYMMSSGAPFRKTGDLNVMESCKGEAVKLLGMTRPVWALLVGTERFRRTRVAVASRCDEGSTRVIQRRFNVSVPRARVLGKASTLRDRSER